MNEVEQTLRNKSSSKEELIKLRIERHDEIPTAIINSTDLDNKYKVRKAWFTQIIFATYLYGEEGGLDTEIKKSAAQHLTDSFASDEFKNKPLVSQEDIQKANDLLDIIIDNPKHIN